MPKPANTFTWATDTNYTNGPQAGSPTKIEPTAGQKAEGWIPDRRAPAAWWNWVGNVIGAWVTYLNTWFDGSDEIVYPVTKTRELLVQPTLAYPAYSTAWRLELASVGWTSPSPAAGEFLMWPLRVPYGATITEVHVLWDPGAARVGAARMRMRLYRLDFNFATFSANNVLIGSEVFDDTTNVWHTRSLTGLTEVHDDVNAAYVVEIACGTGAAVVDTVSAVKVKYLDPGPRNF